MNAALADLRTRLLSGSLNVIRCPAPAGRALTLVDANIGPTAVFWEQADAAGDEPRAIVGLSAAALLRASGPARFQEMMERQATLFQSLRMEPGCREVVRFFGGSAFACGRDGSGCWEDFGDSTFVLPRVLYVERRSGAEFVLIDLPGAVGGTDGTLAVLEAAQRALEDDADELSDGGPVEIEAMRESAGAREFEELVLRAQDEMRAGRVDKVALARRVTLTLRAAPHLGTLLGRLRRTAPSSTRFAFRIGERTFVGATPECLVKRKGLLVETEALAGTVSRTDPTAAAELLASGKNQDEHRYVVLALERCLRPLCRRLEVPSAPIIKELPHLLHLCTPIVAELERPTHVLALVDLLHPTPAVCGAPTPEAFRFIVEQEAAPRGWYAAPFGWADASGDGHFVVGLRSALIHGKNVHLYAGAGIVRASEPQLEFDETELKLQGIRSALGLADGPPRPAPNP